jgi:hypothetical protein
MTILSATPPLKSILFRLLFSFMMQKRRNNEIKQNFEVFSRAERKITMKTVFFTIFSKRRNLAELHLSEVI